MSVFVQCIDNFVQLTYNNSERSDIMAKSTTSNISIRMDSNLKAAAEALYEELGMNLSTAFNIFVRQSLREREFLLRLQRELQAKKLFSAMLEAERIAKDSSVKGYHDVDDFLQIQIMTKYEIKNTTQFKKDYKLAKREIKY